MKEGSAPLWRSLVTKGWKRGKYGAPSPFMTPQGTRGGGGVDGEGGWGCGCRRGAGEVEWDQLVTSG